MSRESLARGGPSPQHNALRAELHDCHLPTRRIALEDVLRLLIEQFGVRPIRSDWGRALHDARASFQRARHW
jgi:hypothetical protein